VIGNAAGGFIVSEAGTGVTWAANSYFYRLTPWQNDPVRDPAGECIYIRDDDSGNVWSPTPEPIREASPYNVRHGAGYSIFDHKHEEIETNLRMGLPEKDPVKVQILSITNRGKRTRKLTVTSYVEWVLGVDREKTQSHVRTEMSASGQAMLARNYFDPQFAHLVAFSAMSEKVSSFTAGRREFIGRNGMLSYPAAMRREILSGDIGDTIDPCAALQSRIDLAPGETREISILLGAGDGDDEANSLIARYL